MSNFSVKFIARGGTSQCPPDPAYPRGVDLDLSGRKRSCQSALPWPAPKLGYYSIQCLTCGFSALITVAGRPDDPRSVRLPCKLEGD